MSIPAERLSELKARLRAWRQAEENYLAKQRANDPKQYAAGAHCRSLQVALGDGLSLHAEELLDAYEDLHRPPPPYETIIR